MVDLERRYPTHEAFDTGVAAAVVRGTGVEIVATDTDDGGLRLEVQTRIPGQMLVIDQDPGGDATAWTVTLRPVTQ